MAVIPAVCGRTVCTRANTLSRERDEIRKHSNAPAEGSCWTPCDLSQMDSDRYLHLARDGGRSKVISTISIIFKYAQFLLSIYNGS